MRLYYIFMVVKEAEKEVGPRLRSIEHMDNTRSSQNILDNHPSIELYVKEELTG